MTERALLAGSSLSNCLGYNGGLRPKADIRGHLRNDDETPYLSDQILHFFRNGLIRTPIFSVCTSMTLTSCVIYPATYYRPSSDTGEVIWSDIGCEKLYDDALSVEYAWGTVNLSLYKRTNEIDEELLIFSASVYPVEDAVPIVQDPTLGFSFGTPEIAAYRYDKIVSQGDEISVADGPPYMLRGKWNFLTIYLEVGHSRSVQLERFGLVVGSERFEIGPVSFDKKIGTKMFTINC